MAKAKALKHGLARPAITRLAANLHRGSGDFDVDGFVASAMRGITRLELKARVAKVADALAEFLPSDYPSALKVLTTAAGPGWDGGDPDDPNRAFAAWPLFHFIEHYGTHDFTRSMAALRTITHLFSAEFAVRPFIAGDPARAFAELTRWTAHRSEHVRRLVSEGSRSRLPWATQVPVLFDDPGAVLTLLERLKDDPSLYVRRSVANNLNDISKDRPELVLDVCEQWLRDASDERRWIVTHATRTLVKGGHPRVWGLLGYTTRPRVEASPIRLSAKRLRIGESLEFTVSLTSTGRSTQRLVIDYAVEFAGAGGASAKPRRKVFKLRTAELAPGEVLALGRTHSFRPISTRRYYAGDHAIELLVNGTSRTRAAFELRPPTPTS